MRERPEDTGIAVGLAVGLHLLVVVLMFVAWLWTPAPEVLSVAGPPIEVELVQAAPVRDHRGQIVLALTAIGPSAALDTRWDGLLARQLRQAAQAASARLGWLPDPAALP